MINIKTYIVEDELGYIQRICPICNRNMYKYNIFDIQSKKIPDKIWNDNRLAIPCCFCYALLNTINKWKEKFKETLKKTAVIELEFYEDDKFKEIMFFTEKEEYEYILYSILSDYNLKVGVLGIMMENLRKFKII